MSGFRAGISDTYNALWKPLRGPHASTSTEPSWYGEGERSRRGGISSETTRTYMEEFIAPYTQKLMRYVEQGRARVQRSTSPESITGESRDSLDPA